jgi:enoyl-CoA hydratase
MDANFTISRKDRVATIMLTRPDRRNALTRSLARDLGLLVSKLEADCDVGCIVLTGEGRAFAAGADIAEMQNRTAQDMQQTDHFAEWDQFVACRLPKIAAVNGYALGGGCELAMMCDIIVAGQSARFGQPEIGLGVMPGMGGTQRLVRLIGRIRAMEMILTGRQIDAIEAERIGLIARVVPDADLQDHAADMAARIASFGRTATILAREAVNRADEMPLREGVLFERRVFHGLFGSPDQIEGMQAFAEKRPPTFNAGIKRND